MSTAELLADDPLWLIIIKVIGIFAFLVVMTLFMIWWERRVVARMQHRVGPNRHGPFGLLQSLADGLKLAFKEDIRPVLADKWVYFLAPVISTIPAFTAFAVIPLGPEVSIFGERTALQLVDLPVGVLVVLACSSIGVYGVVLSGWSSGSPYPLLGSLRSAAQVISYEIAMGLSIVAVILFSGTLSTSGIVEAQTDLWFAVLLIPSFVIYVVSMVGETNRAPFDLPEAESELVGGFHTEYSSLRFAMFMLAEYVNMTTVSALATTLFLGGWHAPWPLTLWSGANSGWWPLLWFVLKVWLVLFVFVWLRATLPRLRYDQFMALGWKLLIPVSVVWVMIVAVVHLLDDDEVLPATAGLIVAGIVSTALLFAYLAVRARRSRRAEPALAPPADIGADPFAGGFPVPPLPPRPDRDTRVSRVPGGS